MSTLAELLVPEQQICRIYQVSTYLGAIGCYGARDLVGDVFCFYAPAGSSQRSLLPAARRLELARQYLENPAVRLGIEEKGMTPEGFIDQASNTIIDELTLYGMSSPLHNALEPLVMQTVYEKLHAELPQVHLN
jgi:hypothetical protein